jgi:hypothetical protein
MDHVVAAPAATAIPVAGGGTFPVRRIYCVGRNYVEHAKEMGFTGREPPFFFLKPADAVVYIPEGEVGEMTYPSLTKDLHHEVELVVAIGTGGRNIRAADAMAHVFGYAVGLDMTRRDLQGEMKKQGRPWDIGKAFDQSAPIGPDPPGEGHHRRRVDADHAHRQRQAAPVEHRRQADLEHRRDDRASFGGLDAVPRRPDLHRHARGRRRRRPGRPARGRGGGRRSAGARHRPGAHLKSGRRP